VNRKLQHQNTVQKQKSGCLLENQGLRWHNLVKAGKEQAGIQKEMLWKDSSEWEQLRKIMTHEIVTIYE
jgi:hypothetical protein